ncbi:MAG: beta-propeller fold lactonase family protein [Clostridia bacterium]|nr:beta-propeller fold lactonase family protein [Clostridia bacterium]
MKKYFYTGSYSSSEENAINLISLDMKSGRMQKEKGFSQIENPSYLAINKQNDRLYALSECDGYGEITAYNINSEGELTKINSVKTKGGQLCHITLNPSETLICVAGYESGTVDIFFLDETRGIGEKFFSDVHFGNGKIEGRQDCPHCHFVFFPKNRDNTFYVTDLGTDELYRYEIDKDIVRIKSKLKIPDADGPRHIVQSGVNEDIIYLVCEISFKIHTIRMHEDGDEIIDTVSTVEDGAEYYGGAGAIRISKDNKYLYVSNRVITPDSGLDSIARFSFDENLLPVNKKITKSGHHMPRDFYIFDDILVSASQTDDKLVSYGLNADNGEIKNKLSEIKLKHPVCIIPYNK